jgi:hypothetical protein
VARGVVPQDDWGEPRYLAARVADRQTRVCIRSLRDWRIFEIVQRADQQASPLRRPQSRRRALGPWPTEDFVGLPVAVWLMKLFTTEHLLRAVKRVLR